MLAFLYSVIFVLLLVIVIQDFKFRAISWISIPLLFVLLLYKSFFISNAPAVWLSFWQNILFIVFQLAFLILYFSIRRKKMEPVINSYLGIGDVLFLICLAPSLCFGNFLLFLVMSLLLILFSYGMMSVLHIKAHKQIPLAGLQSIFLSIWLFSEWFFIPHLSFTYIPEYFAN